MFVYQMSQKKDAIYDIDISPRDFDQDPLREGITEKWCQADGQRKYYNAGP